MKRSETQAISRTEGKHITANDDNNNEWDAAWSDNEDEPSATDTKEITPQKPLPEERARIGGADGADDSTANGDQDDDAADAWGWGDEDTGDDPQPDTPPSTSEDSPNLAKHKAPEAVREVTLTEEYQISSMPSPVFKTLSAILDDAATLTQEM